VTDQGTNMSENSFKLPGAWYDVLPKILEAYRWVPIEEMWEFVTDGVYVGKWVGSKWVIEPDFQSRDAAIQQGYTHFFKPGIPDPPQKRMEI